MEVVLEPGPLTADEWEPFGWLPVADTDPADGRHTLEFAWADPHLNVISHAPDEVTRADDGIVVDRLYRHDSHTQALMPLDVVSVVVVAPAAVTFATASDAEHLRAFRLRPLDRFVLHRGTWHWGPFPVGDAPVNVLNVQGRRYAEDNACVDLGGLGLRTVVPVSR
jgi:ureidoglycolate hydrolase